MKNPLIILHDITNIRNHRDLANVANDIGEIYGAAGTALVELSYPTMRGGIRFPKLRVTSHTLQEEARRQMVDQQYLALTSIVKVERSLQQILSWNDEERSWQGDAGSSSSDQDTSLLYGSSLFLFAPLDHKSFLGFLLHEIKPDQDGFEINAFKSLFSSLCAKYRDGSGGDTPIRLNARELACLKWCCNGETSSQIGTRLGLTEYTINHYLSIVCEKLAARSRPHAVSIAFKFGILTSKDIGLDLLKESEMQS